MVLKVQPMGNSLGVVLPVEIREKFGVEKGDKLFVTATPGGINLSPYDPEFVETIEIARAGMKQYRNALRELAK